MRFPALPLSLADRLSVVVRPHRAAVGNLASMPLTVAGTGCIDGGVFLASPVAGLLVTGLSLMWIEYLIADEGT